MVKQEFPINIWECRANGKKGTNIFYCTKGEPPNLDLCENLSYVNTVIVKEEASRVLEKLREEGLINVEILKCSNNYRNR